MPRDPTKPTIEIWGDKDQIAESRRDLKTLEQYTQENCRVAGKKESRTFTRIRAAPSYRKLEAMREQSKEIERNRQLRRGPTPEMVLPVTSYVIWPKDIPYVYSIIPPKNPMVANDTQAYDVLWS